MHWFNIIIVGCRILSQIHVPQLPDRHEVKKKENPNKQPGCDSHMTLMPCHFEWVPGEKGPKRVSKEKGSGMFWDVPYLPFLSMTAQDGRLGRKRRAGKMRTKRWKKHANPCALCTDDTEAFKAHMLWDQWWLVSIFAALEAPCSSRGCDIHNFRNYSVITCAARHVTNTSTEKGNAKGRGPRRGVGGKRLGAQEPGTKDDDVRISKKLSAFLLKIEIVGFVLALKSL